MIQRPGQGSSSKGIVVLANILADNQGSRAPRRAMLQELRG